MMVLVNLKENREYTYQDYLTWPDEERWEIIDGKAYAMSPAPVPFHQKIVSRLSSLFEIALEGKKCVSFPVPCDVVLAEDTVVQPDLLVVCNPVKITEKNIQGVPALVIEILSPSTSQKDQEIKKDLYERYKVKEYIIIDLETQSAYRYVLSDSGKYSPADYFDGHADMLLVSLPGIVIPLRKIFSGKSGVSWF